jgi:purine-binding chemotaxis protein CheW
MMDDIIDLVQEKNAVEEARKKIDFKMVTFSLAGRDYGIDIMRVKEISKASRFTYVPNTFSFVRGVHNLRGEIISVIDIRQMFNLPINQDKKTKDKLEDILILSLKENKLGIIVDSINKVVGIASETIQPPPPLFRDINVKYISGVVDYDSHLYLILDIERIFEEEVKEKDAEPANEKTVIEERPVPKKVDKKEGVPEIQFITDALSALVKFYVTGLNKDWVQARLSEWKKDREKKGMSFQLSSDEDAKEFLSEFYSPCSGKYFDEDYKNRLSAVLPQASGTMDIWNPGCGKGFETYSLGVICKLKYPQVRLKIWANDISLLDISSAPNLVPRKEELPDYFTKNTFITDTPKGPQYSQEIKDMIYFEYHDVLNKNMIPMIDLIFARDILSSLKPQDQEKALVEFSSKLKPGGMLIVGKNEKIHSGNFDTVSDKDIIVYLKKKENG